MGLAIRRIDSAVDIHAVQRQRYDIYVQELKYAQSHADHVARTVAEPLDANGYIFGAFRDKRLVGSARMNYGELGEYEYLYAVQRFRPYCGGQLCIVTKMMLDRAHRSGTLLARMTIALYEYTRDHRPDARFCLIDCVPPLEGVFARLGARAIGAAFNHPAAGPVLPMAFALYDRHHFNRVGSPLAAVCPYHDCASSEWFETAFAVELQEHA